jgi:hypothetical protein
MDRASHLVPLSSISHGAIWSRWTYAARTLKGLMPGPSVRRELRRSRHHRNIVWDGLHELRHDLPPGGYVQLLVGQLQRNGDV